jgi:hypothetical protein
MREILFRGKRADNKEWVYGDMITGVGPKYGNVYILPQTHIYPKGCNDLDGWKVIPETVGQFTGLTDKNGKEIFEGDKFGNENMPVRHVVFEDGKFCFNRVHSQGADTLSQDRVGRLEIIGNIHDNQELIKQGGAK